MAWRLTLRVPLLRLLCPIEETRCFVVGRLVLLRRGHLLLELIEGKAPFQRLTTPLRHPRARKGRRMRLVALVKHRAAR